MGCVPCTFMGCVPSRTLVGCTPVGCVLVRLWGVSLIHACRVYMPVTPQAYLCSCTLKGCVLVRLWGVSLICACGVCSCTLMGCVPYTRMWGTLLGCVPYTRLSPVLVCLKGHPCTLIAHRQKNKGGRPQGLSGGIE